MGFIWQNRTRRNPGPSGENGRHPFQAPCVLLVVEVYVLLPDRVGPWLRLRRAGSMSGRNSTTFCLVEYVLNVQGDSVEQGVRKVGDSKRIYSAAAPSA
jgi:hypothetical protein